MHVNPVLAAMGGYPLAEIQMRARALRESGRPLIDFSIGDPREPTPDFIRQALIQSIPTVSQYPTTKGLAELRGAIAAYLGRRFGVEVDPASQIIPTTGSKEGIFHTPFAFVTGPPHFNSKGKNFTNNYMLYPSGILENPRLLIF